MGQMPAPRHLARFGWPLPPLAGGDPEGDPTPDPPAGDPPAGDQPPAPQGGGPKTFDEDYVKKLRAEAAENRIKAKRAEELEAKLQEIEDAKKSDLEKATERAAELERRAAAAEQQLLRRKVADDAQLSPAFADRLRGETEEELKTDAEHLKQLMEGSRPTPPAPGDGLPGDVPRGQAPPGSAQISADEARRLAKQDPDKFNRLYDEGKIPGEALQ